MGAVDLVDPDRVAALRRQRPAARRPRRPPGRRGLAAACCSPSTAATWRRPPSPSSGCAPAPIEALRVPANPLDVLAQQVVADGRDGRRGRSTTLFDLVRRTAPFATLPRGAFDATLDLLSGRYPSDEFAELRPAHRLGPRHRHAHRPPGRPAARGHQRRHHPRPRPVRRLPGRRRGPGRAGRRARRGDGLRVPGRRRVRARRDQLADRGHHPRPGAGHPRARRSPGRLPFWKGDALGRPPSSARRSARSPASSAALPREQAIAARAEQPGSTRAPPTTWSPTSTSSARPPASLPSDRTLRGRAVPRRARRLAAGRPLPLRHAGARARGRWRSTPGCASATASTARRWPPTTASCSGSPTPTTSRPAPSVVVFEPDEIERPRHRRGRRLGAVRRRGSASARPARCCCRAATPAGARRCGSSASAAPQLLEVAVEVPVLPDRARGGPRVPAGRLRPARAGRR